MINQKRTQELEELASQILFNNDMYKIPVNLLKIAKNCGITVYDTDFEKLGNKNVSGAIRYVDNNFSILLNKNEPEERKRFTLAHELGHSMHTYYSCNNQPYNLSSYNIFVAEVASTVNELLLAKYVINNSNDKNDM